MRPTAEGDKGDAAMRRGSWDGGRLRILLPLSGARPGRSLDSAGEYRPTTGEPGGRGFRRTGDWTTGCSGCWGCWGCWGCTAACDRVKDAKEGIANAARKAGFARGGESSRFPSGACIIKIRCSPLNHDRSQSCSHAQAGGIVVVTRPRRVKGGPGAASEQIARPKLVPSKRSRSAVATGGVENGARGGAYAGTNVDQPMGRYQWRGARWEALEAREGSWGCNGGCDGMLTFVHAGNWAILPCVAYGHAGRLLADMLSASCSCLLLVCCLVRGETHAAPTHPSLAESHHYQHETNLMAAVLRRR